MRIVLLLAAAIFGAAIVWASLTGDFGATGAFLTSDPWGIVTLADLYLGLLLSAIVIGLFEKDMRIAAFWILPLPFLGNLWTAVWFVARWSALRRRMNGA